MYIMNTKMRDVSGTMGHDNPMMGNLFPLAPFVVWRLRRYKLHKLPRPPS